MKFGSKRPGTPAALRAAMAGPHCPCERATTLELAFLRHELSQPLTYLTATVTLLRKRLGRDPLEGIPEESLAAELSTIQETVLHVNDIVRRIGTGAGDEVELVDLAALVQGTLSMVEPEVERTATIVEDIACNAMVRVNRSRMRQALMNLVTNAVFAVRETERGRGTIIVRLHEEAGWVTLTVRDDGVGIRDEAKEHVGELHFTTRPDSGSGLGLTLCRSIVESHGGTFSLRAAPGGGAIATVMLRVAII